MRSIHAALGHIEYRPYPSQPFGHPVGVMDNGQPIYRPAWADYTWAATWVDARAVRLEQMIRYAVMYLIRSVSHDEAPTCDTRDTAATARDILRGLIAEKENLT